MTVTDRDTVCAVCADSLDPAELFSHECAVCDFCGTPGPMWTLPVRPFADRIRVGLRARELGILYDSGPGDWDVCSICAIHIRVGDWDDVAWRSASLAMLRPDPVRRARIAASLLEVFALVRANTLGPLRPRQAQP